MLCDSCLRLLQNRNLKASCISLISQLCPDYCNQVAIFATSIMTVLFIRNGINRIVGLLRDRRTVAFSVHFHIAATHFLCYNTQEDQFTWLL